MQVSRELSGNSTIVDPLGTPIRKDNMLSISPIVGFPYLLVQSAKNLELLVTTNLCNLVDISLNYVVYQICITVTEALFTLNLMYKSRTV